MGGGGPGLRDLLILVLRECTWNAPAFSLVLPAFDDNGSLGSPLRRVVYPPGSALGDYLQFPCGEYGDWAKTHHFSSLLLFRDFLSFFFSWPPSDMVPFSAAKFNNNNIKIQRWSHTSSKHGKTVFFFFFFLFFLVFFLIFMNSYSIYFFIFIRIII